jgi:phosphoadenosine phosphosulfate reductase
MFNGLSAVKVVFIDTLHLFPETLAFLDEVEARYKFKALRYTPKDFSTYEAYKKVHGVDLPLRDIEKYAAHPSVPSSGL